MLRYRRALQTSGIGEDKLLMDHGHQRDLSWQREQRSNVMQGCRVHCSRLHQVLGHAWLDFPNRLVYSQQQQHCGLSLQALLSRDFLCSEVRLWSWTVHLHNKSLCMILKSKKEKWTKATFLHLTSPICSSLKGVKTPQRHCQTA